MSEAAPTVCGTVAIIGRPNAGKSTLLNALLGQKISIVSPKVQTTRTRITGILTEGTAQIIMVDTPGVIEPQTRLERSMLAAAHDALHAVDLVVHLVDVTLKNPVASNSDLIKTLPSERPVFLVFNKIDQIAKPKLLELIVAFQNAFAYREIFMISARSGDGVDGLRRGLVAAMPQGPWLYPEDQVTDIPSRFMAAEITREKIFLQLHQELPYACMVETESWERDEHGTLHIGQTIIVQRDTQKAIVLGKGGSRIQAIGQASRLELQELLQEEKIYLKLFVKVLKDWDEQSGLYDALGLNPIA